MSDLREAVERLPPGDLGWRERVLALIPEDAVLVTQDELAEALVDDGGDPPLWEVLGPAGKAQARKRAGVILEALARLRSRPSPTEEKG